MEKTELLLSLVIPAYNMERYIIPCIESVITNKGVDKESFEVIVVNDGSTDDSQRIVEHYIEQHPGYHVYLINQKNQGVSVARNVGLAKAQGKFVWFVDGDDLISNESLANIISVLNFNIDLIRIGDCVSNILFGNNNAIVASYVAPVDLKQGYILTAYKLLSDEYAHGHTTYIWKRQFLLDCHLEYPVGISQNEDYCFLVPALLYAKDAYVNLSFQFYLYREDICSVSRGEHDELRLNNYVHNKFAVLNRLLKLNVLDKSNGYVYYINYLNRYVYTIVADCFFLKYPFYLLWYVLKRLKAMKLYPMKFLLSDVSKFRIWLFSHVGLFMIACYIYRWTLGLMKK